MVQWLIKIVLISVIYWVYKVQLVTNHVTFDRAVLIVGILMINLIHCLVMIFLCSSSFFYNYNFLTSRISFILIKACIWLGYLVIFDSLLTIITFIWWFLTGALIKHFISQLGLRISSGILFKLSAKLLWRWPMILPTVSFWGSWLMLLFI